MKHKRNEEPENHERWLVSYADFITLLFAFFTVMYATSQGDNEKQAKFEQSFKQAFGLPQNGSDGVLSQPFPYYQKDGSIIEPQIKIFNDKYASKSEVRDAIWQILNNNLSKEQIQKAGLSILDEEKGIRIILNSENIFTSGSAKIIPDALLALDAVGGILKKTDRPIQIEGHSDSVEDSGLFPSIWELAAGRAATVVRYMIRRHKMDPSKLSAVSYADQRPLVSGAFDQNKSKNRRIEVLVSLDSY